MLNKEDFVLTKIDDSGFEDYWFSVGGDTAKYLSDAYKEQGMLEVTDVVYSRKEDKIGIKRRFLWNFDIIISDDDELKTFVMELVNESKAREE